VNDGVVEERGCRIILRTSGRWRQQAVNGDDDDDGDETGDAPQWVRVHVRARIEGG
jgi:hypothetical protein